MLDGMSRIWIADVRLEPVGLDVATTNIGCGAPVREKPENLDFSEG
jgi:hypothetical protein